MATHSYFPWSVSSLFSICNAPAGEQEYITCRKHFLSHPDSEVSASVCASVPVWPLGVFLLVTSTTNEVSSACYFCEARSERVALLHIRGCIFFFFLLETIVLFFLKQPNSFPFSSSEQTTCSKLKGPFEKVGKWKNNWLFGKLGWHFYLYTSVAASDSSPAAMKKKKNNPFAILAVNWQQLYPEATTQWCSLAFYFLCFYPPT